ncbi:hypothetical protein [Cellulomonas sp. NPDC089187]|uniref:hypothetical protein n=1 Tax=Cellulomonas sp. NPDC089187 TaxID=3154970 RepID=UPI003440711B
MTQQVEQKKNHRKVWAVLGVAALSMGVVGVGALSTLYTSIDDNHFSAAVPDKEVPTKGALLRLTGDPIDHVFDSAKHNDLVIGSWTLTNHGTDTTEFDGTFELGTPVSADLAKALTVQYGIVDAQGKVTRWVDAGTVAKTATFGSVTGITSIDGAAAIPVEVRVVLEDPALIEDAGTVGEMLKVNADFVVSYLDPQA